MSNKISWEDTRTISHYIMDSNRDTGTQGDEVRSLRVSALCRLRNSIVKRFAPTSNIEKDVLSKYSCLEPIPEWVNICKSFGGPFRVNTRSVHTKIGRSGYSLYIPDDVDKPLILKGSMSLDPIVRVSDETFDLVREADYAFYKLEQQVVGKEKEQLNLLKECQTYEDLEMWDYFGFDRDKLGALP